MRLRTLARCSLAVVATLVVAGSAQAQTKERNESAFGFYKGMTLKQARAVATLTEIQGKAFFFHTPKPPSPVTPFISYAVHLAPKAGICAVFANSAPLPTDTKEAENAITRIGGLLAQRYGVNATQGEDGSLTWVDPQGPGTWITLKVKPKEDKTASLGLAYRFSNADECMKEGQTGI